MVPKIYFQIALLMINRDLVASAFSIPEILVQGGKEIIKNVGG